MKRKMTARKLAAIIAAAMVGVAFGDIYMAGDSTMCSYPPHLYPQQGWG